MLRTPIVLIIYQFLLVTAMIQVNQQWIEWIMVSSLRYQFNSVNEQQWHYSDNDSMLIPTNQSGDTALFFCDSSVPWLVNDCEKMLDFGWLMLWTVSPVWRIPPPPTAPPTITATATTRNELSILWRCSFQFLWRQCAYVNAALCIHNRWSNCEDSHMNHRMDHPMWGTKMMGKLKQHDHNQVDEPGSIFCHAAVGQP